MAVLLVCVCVCACVCVCCDCFFLFAAGADIKEMAPRSYMDVYNGNMFASWGDVAKLRTPVGWRD